MEESLLYLTIPTISQPPTLSARNRQARLVNTMAAPERDALTRPGIARDGSQGAPPQAVRQ
ncbi:hypothetical protein TSACC_2713 [Terrimicrobium sacchariphilum]|uniref:Uncharacterized protein n=1 Tax=Terrimicrobium sacchariphilum TaxID=690879 RepID=A0A146G3B5_TERSA|nr:hypothetical protein TSACC_2713 [Terrimicrobium sacchariphilum]